MNIKGFKEIIARWVAKWYLVRYKLKNYKKKSLVFILFKEDDLNDEKMSPYIDGFFKKDACNSIVGIKPAKIIMKSKKIFKKK